MKILVDMNLSPSWCEVLRRYGWEAVHWSAVGRSNAKDREIMEWASREGHVVLTHDLDFGALLAATQATSPSVVLLRAQDVFPAHLEQVVVSVLRRHAEALREGAIVAVDETRGRMRVLPLRR